MKLEIFFLKAVVFLIAIPILTLSIIGLPWLVNNPANPQYAHILYPIVIGMYVSVIPFFVTLYQAFKLLGYIGNNKAFTELSMKALKNIKYCALAISIILGLIMPFIFLAAEMDDAPGLILVGLAFTCAPIVAAVMASVLQKLLKNIMDIKAN